MTGALTRQESTSGGDGSVLSNLAGGMRVVKSFPVERSNAAPSAQDWQSILRHVKLEWTGASTILLRRLPPQPPLTFQL